MTDAAPRKRYRVTLLRADSSQLDEFEVIENSNLWVFVKKHRHPIGSSCSGVGVCGACHIKLDAANAKCLSTQTQFEKETLRKNGRNENDRLACLCRVISDVTLSADYW